MVNLHTADVVEAKRRRDELESQTRIQFRQIKMGRKAALELPGWKPREAAAKRGTLGPAERGTIWREALADEDDPQHDLIRDVVADEAERFRNDAQRRAFTDSLTGREKVAHHVETYLPTTGLVQDGVNERRGLLRRFAGWADEKGLTLDRIDRKQAGRYVTEKLEQMHTTTQGKHLTALRSYWVYLAKRGHISIPPGTDLDAGWPWNGQQIAKRGKRMERGIRDEPERPFTDDEVRALLYSPWPMKNPDWESGMRDAIKISLLSGMRRDELLKLWVEDVDGDWFDIKEGKTEAAARRVPIHANLKDIVKRRLAGKQPGDWLFHELQIERDPGDTFGKRFKRFREAVGVADNRDGVRRSLVNFHSARRWFATKARHAGHPEATIGQVVGHKPDKGSVTFGVYARDASEGQLRDCVGDVKLP